MRDWEDRKLRNRPDLLKDLKKMNEMNVQSVGLFLYHFGIIPSSKKQKNLISSHIYSQTP